MDFWFLIFDFRFERPGSLHLPKWV